MLIILILNIFLMGALATCPPAESIAPVCLCRDIGQDSMMTCSNVFSAEELIPPIKSLAVSKQKVFSLEISNSSLMYLPHDLFENTGIEKIRFVNTQLMSLSNEQYAFEGLEDTLTEIRATDAHYIAQWDWQQLQKLQKLDLMDVNWISMKSVAEPLPELKKLTAFGIIRAEIAYIADYAFAKLPQLAILNLQKNEIKEMKRNMLPDPANKLSILDLSDNLLEALPPDFFVRMPAISYVYLKKQQVHHSK